MIGIIIDLTYYTTKFIVKNLYSGVSYMIWGKPKDPLLQRIEYLEKLLITHPDYTSKTPPSSTSLD
jgi:hypothetical protein